MGKKQISRKEFFIKALTGIAGISLVSKQFTGLISSLSEFRGIGGTGIITDPLRNTTRCNPEH